MGMLSWYSLVGKFCEMTIEQQGCWAIREKWPGQGSLKVILLISSSADLLVLEGCR